MTRSSPTPTTILAAIDYSDTSSLVVEQATRLARVSQPSELHFLHVAPRAPRNDEEREALRAELQEWLSARLRTGESLTESTRVVAHEASGDPAHVIVEMAGDLMADMVVVGTHGRKGMQRMVMGSVSESVVRTCGCPVLVVRDKAHHEPVPRIEPPCPRCLETRAQSGGQELWCETHREKHGRRHTYYSTRVSSWVNQRMMP